MNFAQKLTAALAVTVFASGVAHAVPAMTYWVFNPVGEGRDSGQEVTEYLDFYGSTFFQIQRTEGNSYTFRQHGAVFIPQADSNGSLFPLNYQGGNITALFDGYGTGQFGGAFSFGGGTVRLYQNPVDGQYASSAGIYGANLGNLIAELSVKAGGGGAVDDTGVPVSSGNFSMFAGASPGSITAGYFFDSDGSDLATRSISFELRSANSARPGGQPPNLVSEIACQYAGFTGAGCSGGMYQDVQGEHFFVSAIGQVLLSEVPEPGSVALFGVAMFAAGAARRRRGTVRQG